ncbi:M48 family metalloprotease [Nakamurella sp. YIM 132087]|uniref:M48 family metalloprotease n=1 Tax=Nakamurella alba TaxID=2665158 RepID=A0A7K1FQN6_9ACTN|nr:M56 family metallopeptidase [Nakamurella alba]MTD16456.1 M48 family metalloprotease [Nakamurella alba]
MAAPVLALLLAVASVILAGPVSWLLARARWTRSAPRAALVLFQSVCLAAGLSLVGAGFVIAVERLGHNIVTGVWQFGLDALDGRPLAGMTGRGIMAGTLATAVAVVLFGTLLRSLVLAQRRRRAHRMLLDLLTGEQPGAGEGGTARGGDVLAGVRILDHAGPVAYTLPGWHSRVVLTAGLVDLLDPDELAAVVAHERAHVRSRHDLLVLPFQAWSTVLGWLPGVRQAAASVAELTEMLADDWAVRQTSAPALTRALAKVALAGVPQQGAGGAITPAVAGRAVAGRVERLRQPAGTRTPSAALVYLLAALLLAVPTVALVIGWR